jgi:predicted negative regulator of RcsB-dependent stress response
MKSINDQVKDVAASAYVTLLSRIAICMIGFMGMQIWSDTRENHDRMTTVLINQAVAEAKLDAAIKRIDKIELSDHASYTVPMPNFGTNAATGGQP